jgi:hypothetical protein
MLAFRLQISWEQGEIIFAAHTKEQQVAEQHLMETTTRDERGCFIIRLPHHVNHPPPRHSYSTAECRFQQLGIKLAINIELHKDYTRFMEEYVSLRHMHLESEDQQDETSHDKMLNKSTAFLPSSQAGQT